MTRVGRAENAGELGYQSKLDTCIGKRAFPVHSCFELCQPPPTRLELNITVSISVSKAFGGIYSVFYVIDTRMSNSAFVATLGGVVAVYVFFPALLRLTQDSREPQAVLQTLPFLSPIFGMIRWSTEFYPHMR